MSASARVHTRAATGTVRACKISIMFRYVMFRSPRSLQQVANQSVASSLLVVPLSRISLGMAEHGACFVIEWAPELSIENRSGRASQAAVAHGSRVRSSGRRVPV